MLHANDKDKDEDEEVAKGWKEGGRMMKVDQIRSLLFSSLLISSSPQSAKHPEGERRRRGKAGQRGRKAGDTSKDKTEDGSWNIKAQKTSRQEIGHKTTRQRDRETERWDKREERQRQQRTDTMNRQRW